MSPPPARILIVEDDPDTLSILWEVLVQQGHVVDCVRDALSAVTMAARVKYDVLISDIILPGRTGWWVMEELASSGRLPSKVVAMSVSFDRFHPSWRQPQLAHVYLAKPFRLEELYAAIGSAHS